MKRTYCFTTSKSMMIISATCEFSRQVGTSYTTIKKQIIIV